MLCTESDMEVSACSLTGPVYLRRAQECTRVYVCSALLLFARCHSREAELLRWNWMSSFEVRCVRMKETMTVPASPGVRTRAWTVMERRFSSLALSTTASDLEIFDVWNDSAETAEAMLPVIGNLYRHCHIVTNVYGQSLVNLSPLDILRVHREGKRVAGTDVFKCTISETFPILKACADLALSPAKIDLGRLAKRYYERCAGGETGLSVAGFVQEELAGLLTSGRRPLRVEPQDVVLYGFGRIGRLLARILIDKIGGGDKFRLRAVVVRPPHDPEGDLEKRAALFELDSVHGRFRGTIDLHPEQNALILNGNVVRFIYANSPDSIDYTEYGIQNAIILDNTGVWRDRKGLGKHLLSNGVANVILTAPAKGDIPNIVAGVNTHELFQKKEDGSEEHIFSAASCTTNAIVPILKVMNTKFGIEYGHVETCHSYTNDQNLIDNYHPKARRGRAAALNMVITETGAAEAVAKALPELTGRLSGNSIRVPTPNVSLAILNLQLQSQTTLEEVDAYLRETAFDSNFSSQIDYVNGPDVVSSDFVGNKHSSIVDANATIVANNGKTVILYVWYDNEFGYSAQVIRVVQNLAGIVPPTYPALTKLES